MQEKLLLFLYFANVSIDLSDESFHFYLFTDPTVGYPFFLYGALFGPIADTLDLGIPGIRIMGYLIQVICLSVLAIATKKTLLKDKQHQTLCKIALPLLLASSFSTYAVQGRIPSYNSLTCCCLALWLASLLVAMDHTEKKYCFPGFLLLGITAFFQCGIKFPCGFALILLSLGIPLAQTEYRKKLIKAWAGIILGILLCIGFYSLNFNLASLTAEFKHQIALFETSQPVLQLLTSYAISV